MLVTTIVSAQSLVSSTPQKRVAVLEEFTGVNCGYCPEGHAISDSLAELYGDRFIPINIHSGNFAQPIGNQPDFRTANGNAIDTEMQPSGYPNATVNRLALNGDDVSVGRSTWAGYTADVLLMDSPLNVGMKSDFNADTRELTVQVDVYYTSDMDSSSYINVVLTESGIVGPQVDYGPAGDHTDYIHNHVFRAMLTDTWGDEVLPTSGLVSRTYTYTVPEEIVVENADVSAFVTENRRNIYSGAKVEADGGATIVVVQLSGNQENQYSAGNIGEFNTYNYSIQNTLGADDIYMISVSDNAPEAWEAIMTVNGAPLGEELTLAADEIGDLLVEIRPCTTPGIAKYTITFQSTTDPEATIITQDIYIIGGVKDLIIENAGAENWTPLYDDGLTAMNHVFKASTDVVGFKAFSKAGALTDVNNIFYNVSWTFPAFTESTVLELEKFIDNGGNLLIAGQDIGWDNLSGSEFANGTELTAAFYTNYLQADFINDGSDANASISGVPGDILADIPISDIAEVFADATQAHSYPEVIAPLGTATSIFHYNEDTDLIGGIKGTIGDAKIVYLGIGLEQLANTETGPAIMESVFNWFYEGVTIDTELMECFAVGIDNIEVTDLMGNVYPNPSADFIVVPFDDLSASAQLSIYSHDGRLIKQRQIPANSPQIKLSTTEFANGLYMINLITTDGKTQSKHFLIQK